MTQMSFFGPSGDEPKPSNDEVVRLRILVVVKTAPIPSATYGATVCVAGVSVDFDRPGWVRLFPIAFPAQSSGFAKDDLVEVDATPSRRDSRRESWRPRMGSLRVAERGLDWRTKRRWLEPYVDDDVTMCSLQRAAADLADAASLALVRPRRVTGFKVERHGGWTPGQQANVTAHTAEPDLFGTVDITPLPAPRFTGKYHYLCRDSSCSGHRQETLDEDFVAMQRGLVDVRDQTAAARLTREFRDRLCAPERDIGFYVGNQVARRQSFSVGAVHWFRR